IGAGGMGVVWLADDPVLHRSVAIKSLASDLVNQSLLVKRFLREARAVARLSHPHVVGIHDVVGGGGDGEQPYLVMEYLPGGSAHDLLAKGQALPWMEATRLILQAGRGLAAAHAAGLIHRDIKPANLLLATDGTVKLADFGLVKIVDLVSSSTTPSEVLGTPQYMSPEQCRGEELDERSDQYSLAATWYTLLTTRALFKADSTYGLLFAQCSEPPPD